MYGPRGKARREARELARLRTPVSAASVRDGDELLLRQARLKMKTTTTTTNQNLKSQGFEGDGGGAAADQGFGWRTIESPPKRRSFEREGIEFGSCDCHRRRGAAALPPSGTFRYVAAFIERETERQRDSQVEPEISTLSG